MLMITVTLTMLSLLVMRVWVLVQWVLVCYVINLKAGISDVNVTNTAINQLPNDAQLVITQKH